MRIKYFEDTDTALMEFSNQGLWKRRNSMRIFISISITKAALSV